jgi:hypothetical protein
MVQSSLFSWIPLWNLCHTLNRCKVAYFHGKRHDSYPMQWRPLGQMNRNLVASIYGRSSIKNVHFDSIRNKHGRHMQFLMLIGRFLKKIFSPETAWPNESNSMFVNGSQMSNLYRGPSIDAIYHVSVHLAKQFQSRKCFRNRPISNKNCLCRRTETW